MGLTIYAAANNAPILIQDGKLIELPYDKMPIGAGEKNDSFRLHTINHQPSPDSYRDINHQTLYLFTDGYADQFGGGNGKKFKNKQLKGLLLSINEKPMSEQKEILNKTFDDWKGNLEQVDDVLVIGIRI